jgi:hypothetical protein
MLLLSPAVGIVNVGVNAVEKTVGTLDWSIGSPEIPDH